MNDLRQTALSQVEIVASKSRFGLFSQAPPLAIGDDSLFRSKQAIRGEDGKPKSKPRNILAGHNRTGVGKNAFISHPQSVHAGDRYLDPEKVDYLYNKKFHTPSNIHQRQFKPGSGSNYMAKIPYKYTDQNPSPKQRPARDETGRVITSERNVATNPMHRVQNDLFKAQKYMSDPYNRKEISASQQRKLSRGKMPKEMPRNMSHGDILFSTNRTTFGFDSQAEIIMKSSRSPFVMSAPKKFRHDSQFKFARRGHGDPIGKYPQFIMPQARQTQSSTGIRINRGKSEKEEWRPNGNRSISRPTPSISYSSINLRKMM